MPIVSYPVLRCVLEHMEANSRISISARCPEISKVEKRIPLRVDKITFRVNAVLINDTECRIFFRSKFFVEKNVSRYYRAEVSTRKVVKNLLGGRNNIRVKSLTIWCGGFKTMQYLFGISKMKVSTLTSWETGLPRCYPLIQSPLKVLNLYASHPTDFENPIARAAEKLSIMLYGYERPDIWLETHRNLPNKDVVIGTLDYLLTDKKILDLIEHWRETRKAVGSSFSVNKVNGASIEKFSENVKERFQGIMSH